MHADLPDSPPGTPTPAADTGPWYQGLNRYHIYVLIVASLGWLFDTMDQRIFLMSRQPAMTDLLGYKIEKPPGEEKEQMMQRDGTLMSEDARKAANGDISWYSGLATAIFMLGWATGGLFFGIMGDRWGRARTMLLTILIYSAFTGLSALSQFVWDFMFYRFITGMGVGGEFAAGVALVAEVMPNRARPFALGLLQALSAVGNIMGSLLSGYIMDLDKTLGWRFTFLLGTLPALMVVAVRRTLKEPDSWQQAKATGAIEVAAKEKLGKLSDLLHVPRWRYNTIIGLLLALSGVVGLWGVGFWTFELVTVVLRPQGYSSESINRIRGYGTALQDVGAFFGILAFSMVTAWLGRRVAFAAAFSLALAATWLVFGQMKQESDIYWMLPLLGFCNLAVFGGFAIYFPELYPTRLRSTGTGFCYNVARYIAALGPFTLGGLVGLYTQSLGDVTSDVPFRYAALTVASIYVLGLLVIPFMPETKGKPLPE